MAMRDVLGAIFEDEDFATLFPRRGQPAMAPWKLALVTVMQFAEGLSDRQAADAVRARIDWKYALSLELSDPGFDASVLCEFRGRLLEGGSDRLLFDHLLERFREMGLVKARGKQRTDSTRILAVVRGLNRLELVGETMRHALDALSTVAPGWLLERIRPEWERCYARRLEDHRLPKGKEARIEKGVRIGADGHELLEAIYSEETPSWLREVPAVETLRRVWLQNFFRDPEGKVGWRTAEEGIPPSRNFLGSPIDRDCRYARKFTTSWLGYRVHLTETCDDGKKPNIITDIRTAPATVADGEATPLIHEALEEKDLLPETQFVDTGYLDAELLFESKEKYGVDLFGPTRPDRKWQAKEGTGFEAAAFILDWEHEIATCPEGKKSISWSPAIDNRYNHVMKIKFSSKDCMPCPSREKCIRSRRRWKRRSVTVRADGHQQALEAARKREKEPGFAAAYARRAGIEGTISRAVRTCSVRRSKYVGLEKTQLHHLLSATALNFLRVGEWLMGMPKATTRRSPFARLIAASAAA
jgi:transposase